MDEIILNETQTVSVAREAPSFMDSDCDENELYQVEKMSLEETREKLEWNKCAFERKHKITYGIEMRNDMIHIHDKEVNKIPK